MAQLMGQHYFDFSGGELSIKVSKNTMRLAAPKPVK